MVSVSRDHPCVLAGSHMWWGGEEEGELQKGNAHDAFRTLSAPQSMRKLRVKLLGNRMLIRLGKIKLITLGFSGSH